MNAQNHSLSPSRVRDAIVHMRGFSFEQGAVRSDVSRLCIAYAHGHDAYCAGTAANPYEDPSCWQVLAWAWRAGHRAARLEQERPGRSSWVPR
jgi:hypothetical protein